MIGWLRRRLRPAGTLLTAARKELVRMDEEYAIAVERATKAEERERLLAARLKIAEGKLYRIRQAVDGPMRPYSETLRLIRMELAKKEES